MSGSDFNACHGFHDAMGRFPSGHQIGQDWYTTYFREPKARARALGVWSAVAAGGGAAGALLGGVLTDLLSWRWILFINIPIGALGLLAARPVLGCYAVVLGLPLTIGLAKGLVLPSVRSTVVPGPGPE